MTTADLNGVSGATSRVPHDETSRSNNAWRSGGSTSSMVMEDGSDDDESQAAQHRKYERKNKRFAWPDELHRLFVAAIFDLGLQNASPKALMSFMMPAAASAGLTSEHLKSHLQKYRLNYDKSRAEFLAFFDESAKRNGKRRRRRSDRPLDRSHTKFIFPIDVPSTAVSAGNQGSAVTAAVGSAGIAGASPSLPLPHLMRLDTADHVPAPQAYAQLSPRTSNRLERASLLRLAQQNAAMAFAASQSLGGGGAYGTGLSPRPMNLSSGGDGTPVGIGADGVSEAQWRMLESLLAPQSPAVTGNNGNPNAMIPPVAPFSLNEDASPDLQMQMHVAMQAQMNLHRQMLTRKVAVSQNYYNQAAAVKRAAASAMVERALRNVAFAQQQQQQQEDISMPVATRPSIDHGKQLLHQQQQQFMQQQQLQLQQQSLQPPQRYRPSVAGSFGLGLAPIDPLPLMPPATWDPIDIDMGGGVTSPDDQNDLFSFLKSTE